MTEDVFKVLALLACGLVGYFYSYRKHKQEVQEHLTRMIIEEQNEQRQTEEIINNTPTEELVRHANRRLRKRRAPSGSDT